MQIPEEVQDEFKNADDRGRIHLGPEFKNKRVRVAIIEVEE